MAVEHRVYCTLSMDLPILYFMGSQVKISKFQYISVPFILASSADPDERPPKVEFHLGQMKCHNSGSSLYATVLVNLYPE